VAHATLELTLEPEVVAALSLEAQAEFPPVSRPQIIGNYLREIYSSDDLEPIDEVGSRRQLQKLRIALKTIDLWRCRGDAIPIDLMVKLRSDDILALIAAVNQLRYFWHTAESDVPGKIDAAIEKVRHKYADRCGEPPAKPLHVRYEKSWSEMTHAEKYGVIPGRPMQAVAK
jgi:hypothetical protein